MTGSERVMVFGAGGFLGGRICALLAERGIEHRGFTRSSGEPHRQLDLTEAHHYALDTQLGMYKPTVIVNAAAATQGDVAALTRGNVVAVQALLESARHHATNARFVQIGLGGGVRRGAAWDEPGRGRGTPAGRGVRDHQAGRFGARTPCAAQRG